MTGHYFARQPILDRQQKIFAYELLYRGDRLENSAGEFDGDSATTEVMMSSLVDVGLAEVVGESPALINVTSAFLNGELALPEEKDRLILEILEDIEPTDEIVAAVRNLAQRGYRLALDDYEHHEKFEPLLQVVELVKLDIRALDAIALTEHVEILRNYDCKLLAEKVETHDEYLLCKQLGFDYFQGYFFCEPQRLTAQRAGVNHAAALQLMTRLQDEGCGFDEIQELIVTDAALAIRLLRFANSPFCGIGRDVKSIRDALSLVGLDLVRRWVTLMLMTRLGETKSPELINLALIRGRMCELLGIDCEHHDGSEYFTVGLFSIMDALFDQPMALAVEALPLNEEIKDAIRRRNGVMGETLDRVISFQRDPMGDASDDVVTAYRDGVHWANQLAKLA